MPHPLLARLLTHSACWVTLSASSAFGQTPVDVHGHLATAGNRIVDGAGDPVCLPGMSLFWSNTTWGGEHFYTPGVVQRLAHDWKAKVVRAAMGVEDYGGFLSDPTNQDKVETVVDAAVEEGLYVIIDWHSHHAEDYQQQAITFFTDMANQYGHLPNVIYEIYNEPLGGVSWSNTIKPYAEAVIAAIRAVDPDNLIVVGTPTWSQDVDVASLDPITSSTNIAYSLHFYAATHREWNRQKAQTALNNGIPLFVTEWGSVNAWAQGSIDYASVRDWMEFLRENDIGHCNWALNDKNEPASALFPGASRTGHWTTADLTPAGVLAKNIVETWFTTHGGGNNPGADVRAITDRPGDLLEDSPLSRSAPHYQTVNHGLAPTWLWGQRPGPLKTNAWWQNLVLNNGTSVVNSLPYLLRTDHEGIRVCVPDKVVTNNFILSPFIANLRLGSADPLGGRSIAAFDDLSVTVQWANGTSSMTTPLVRGMPYVTAQYADVRPRISSIHAILTCNGQNVGSGINLTDTRFDVRLNNGQTWLLYASAPITLNVTGGHLEANANYTGSLRAAFAPAGSETVLDDHAGRIPVGGDVSAYAKGDRARLDFMWRTVGDGPLLMMSLPHHRDRLPGKQLTSHQINTLRGDMVGVTGDRWRLPETLTKIAWGAPSGIDPNRVAAIRTQLGADINTQVQATDPYFAGKQLAALGRLALIADEVGEAGHAQTYRNRLKNSLQPWLDGTNPSRLVYDQTWGGIIAENGANNPSANFGQGYYNDHHFHYGYHIYAAAALAKTDPQWRQQNGDKVLHLVRDIANPAASADPYYTRMRCMDWFVGHSWAAGLFEFGDSRNQESTSEAVNAWYAVYLWGLVTENERLRDLGRLMLATEIRSAQRYWQITSGSDIYPAPFADNKVVGILWGTKVDYTTFFGGNTEYIHGIQMLPFTPISEELLRRDWITEEYPVLSTAIPSASQGWLGFIYMAHAIVDPNAAWNEIQTLTSFDDGNSRSNAMYWAATR